MEVDFTQKEGESNNKDHSNSVVIPEAYICPLTHMIINDPVIFFDDGLTYEREALESWTQDKKTNPITKKPLKQTGTFPNGGLKNLIQKFLTTHGNHPAIKARCYKTKQQQLDQTWLLAAKKGHVKTLKKAYDKGANPLTQDAKGNTACHLACLSNNPIKMLEAVYACVKAYLVTQKNNVAEEDEKDTDSNAIPKASINSSNQQALQWMCQTNYQGQTALHVTVDATKLERAQQLIPHLLTTYGISVDAPDKANQTPLHYAAKQSAKPLLRALIQRGASLYKLDNQKKTPLNLAPKLATWMRDEYLNYLNEANQTLKRKTAQQHQRLIEAEKKVDDLDTKYQAVLKLNTQIKTANTNLEKTLRIIKADNAQQSRTIQSQQRSLTELKQEKAKSDKHTDQLQAQLQTAMKSHQTILASKERSIQQLQHDKKQFQATIQTLNTQLSQEKIKADKQFTQLQLQLQTITTNHQAILGLKENDIQQLQQEKKKLQTIIQTLNNPLKKQGNDVDEKEITQDNLANKWHFFEKPKVKIVPMLKRQIDRALETAKKNQDFSAVEPLVNQTTARYIYNTIYTAKWLESYFAPNPKYPYANRVIPKVQINEGNVIVKNDYKGYELFTWPFTTQHAFELHKQVWQGEEGNKISIGQNIGVNKDNIIHWDKHIYTHAIRNKMGFVRKSDKVKITKKALEAIGDRTKGFVGAQWVGTKERGLVKATTNFCELIQYLQKVENLDNDINTTSKSIKK